MLLHLECNAAHRREALAAQNSINGCLRPLAFKKTKWLTEMETGAGRTQQASILIDDGIDLLHQI
jgi:hypothetical protein